MHKRIGSLLLLYAVVVCSPVSSGACGDKLLVLPRGVSFDTFVARHKASILLYIPDTLPASAAINDAEFQSTLQKAGHTLASVREPASLGRALQSGQYDVILSDLQDASYAEQQVAAAAVNTTVMPVVYESAYLRRAQTTQLMCVRKPAGNARTCFSTLEKAVEAKRKRDKQQHRASR